MYLKDVNEGLDSKIVDGSEHQWSCWDNARFLDYESDFAHASVVFNYKTQEIYSAEVNDKEDKHKPYRWLNPEYKQDYVDEAKERGVDPDQAWDNKKYYDLDVASDWLEKAKAIFNNQIFDTRVQMEVDLDNDILLQLALGAHKQDITMNKYIEKILQQLIDKHNVNETVE